MPKVNKSKVKEIMKKRGINTQTELSKRIGITSTQLSLVLSNKFNPIKQEIMKISKILGIIPTDIIVKREENFTYNFNNYNYACNSEEKTDMQDLKLLVEVQIPKVDESKVKEIMKTNNISTQKELSKKSGVEEEKLSRILSSKYNPVKRTVIRIAETIGISVIDIISEGDIKKEEEPNYNKDKSDIKVLELFAGAGGLSLGLEQAGLDTVGFVEVDDDCCKTLKNNRPGWNVIHKDIRKVDFTKFSSNQIDVVTGGFPCQAFSDAGKKLGFEDTRGTLFFEFARAVKEIKPKVFVAENVPGITRHDGGKTLETILNVLSDFGYDVKYKKLNAVNYFVPQKRKRVFIVGTLPEVSFEFPEPFNTVVTIREALKNCPESDGVEYSNNREQVYRQVPPGGYWRDLPEEVQKEFMGKSYYSGGGRTGIARRMSWDEPALTLMASPAQKRTERIHPEETRPFTVREYARLQTFPDEWDFEGSTRSKYKQIGNAVPVKLAYFIGNSIRNALGRKGNQFRDSIKSSNINESNDCLKSEIV